MIRVQRVYKSEVQRDGKRFLVDRLWPRGIKKEALHFDAWIKEVAPSNTLRNWYNHEPEKWNEFKSRYFLELDRNPATWKPILEVARHHDVTLLYSSKEEKLNNAVALKSYLDSKL